MNGDKSPYLTRLAKLRIPEQKAGVKDEPPTKPRRRLGRLRWWLLAIFLAACGYQAWLVHDYQAAVREAKEAGFEWTCTDTISLIRQDWRNALKKETWATRERSLSMQYAPELARFRDLIHRLQPTKLVMPNYGNVDVLRGLNSIKSLTIKGGFNNMAPLNLDGLKDLTALQSLEIEENWGILGPRNIDALYGLKNLRVLRLFCCPVPPMSLHQLNAALPNLVITSNLLIGHSFR